MAKATKEVIPAVFKETLTLTQEEADVLLSVTSRIGGLPEVTRRGLIDGIRRALIAVGGICDYTGDMTSSIHFESETL